MKARHTVGIVGVILCVAAGYAAFPPVVNVEIKLAAEAANHNSHH
jgi:hypothetical protein